MYNNVNDNNVSYAHTFEILTTGYTLAFLDLIFFISIILTILVIISKNPIVSVLFLIGLFFNIACYLILLGISFVGLSYLLVYVGAVSILFLFILMLINVRVSELITENTNSIPLVIITAMLFTYPVQQLLLVNTLGIYLYIIFSVYHSTFFNYSNYMRDYLNNITNGNFYVTSEVWDGNLSETKHIASIGNIMYTNYSMWLIITSTILLLAMVGSIVITLKDSSQ